MNFNSQHRLYLTKKKSIEQDIRKLDTNLEYTIFHQTHVDTELEKQKTASVMYVPVIHSTNYGQQYFIQVVVNIIGYFT